MDNHKERIANFRIEPPGLFRGRGDHPKMGMLKRRIRPQDIIINCSKWDTVLHVIVKPSQCVCTISQNNLFYTQRLKVSGATSRHKVERSSSWQQGDLAGVVDGKHTRLHQVHHAQPELQDQGGVLFVLFCFYNKALTGIKITAKLLLINLSSLLMTLRLLLFLCFGAHWWYLSFHKQTVN